MLLLSQYNLKAQGFRHYQKSNSSNCNQDLNLKLKHTLEKQMYVASLLFCNKIYQDISSAGVLLKAIAMEISTAKWARERHYYWFKLITLKY